MVSYFITSAIIFSFTGLVKPSYGFTRCRNRIFTFSNKHLVLSGNAPISQCIVLKTCEGNYDVGEGVLMISAVAFSEQRQRTTTEPMKKPSNEEVKELQRFLS